MRVGTNSTQLIVSFDSGPSLPAAFANAWLGGTKIDDLRCTGKQCVAVLPDDLNLTNILSFGKVDVTVAHDSATVIRTVKGDIWNQPVIDLGAWQLTAGADSLTKVLPREETSQTLQTEFWLDVPYWFLFEEGPFKCKGESGTCGRLVAAPSGPPNVIIEAPAVLKKLNTKNGESVELEFQVKGGVEYTTGTSSTPHTTFTLSASSAPCTFQVTQLTPVSRGVKGAQVLLEIAPVTSDACVMSSWSVASPTPTVGAVVGDSLRLFDSPSKLYVIEVDTTVGDRDSTLRLAFAYPDGTPVDTGLIEIHVEGRASLAPLILVNTNVQAEDEDFTEFEITDTIAQSRWSLIQFRQLSNPEQWQLRLPGGVQAAACDGSKDSEDSNLVRYAAEHDESPWSGFCVDVERSSARTIEFTLERRAMLEDLWKDPANPNHDKFERVRKRELYLGSASETIQAKQAPFTLKVDLLPRVRLVCQGDVGSPATAEIRAFRKSALQQCNLYFELEEGALERLRGKVPRRSWKGIVPQVVEDKMAEVLARRKKADTAQAKADAAKAKAKTAKAKAKTARRAEKDAEAEKAEAEAEKAEAEAEKAEAEAAKAEAEAEKKEKVGPTELDACEDGNIPEEENEKILHEFSAKHGRQKLKVKLWELGEDGEFQAVSGSDNTISIKWDRIDSGAYPQKIQDGVLAVCVDLTHQGKAASKAYDVVKITVDHDDTFYEVAWQDDDPVEYTAKVRRMPALASNFLASTAVGPRFFFSLAIPTLIRYPSTGRESETSSGFQLANAVAFQAGVVFGAEPWNFNENRPASPIFNPQLFVGSLLLGLPTQGHPSPLVPSFIYGVGFRLPSGDNASKQVEASTSLLIWGEVSRSARRETVNAVLFGFNVSIGFLGS